MEKIVNYSEIESLDTPVEVLDDNSNLKYNQVDYYNEYRNELNKMYNNTTEDNSLISSFIVEGNRCRHTLIVKFSDGHNEISKSREFEYNDNFKNEFLLPVVIDYNKYNKVFDSRIEVISDDKSSFIAKTNENDALNIINIDVEFANKIMDSLPKQELSINQSKQLMKLPNEKGIGNFLVIILTIIAIGMTVVGTIFFTIASR